MKEKGDRSLRIGVDEVIEIALSAEPPEAQKELKRHWRIYGDWGRIKQLLTERLIDKNRKIQHLQRAAVQYRAEIEKLKTVSLPL